MLNSDELFIKKLASKWGVRGLEKDDLEQEFRIIYEKCKKNFKEDKETKFSTYFIQACKNRVGKLRKKYTPLPVKDLSDYVQQPDKSTELFEEILESIDTLTYGEYLKDYYIKGKTAKEIADANGVSQQYIDRLIKKGVQELKQKFNS